MSQFLLTTSLVLHLLTFLWIITLLQKVNQQQTSPINEEKIKREIEDLLIAYTTEMKEENERLIEQFKQARQETREAKYYGDEIIEEKEAGFDTPVITKETLVKEPSSSTMPEVKYEDYKPPTIDTEEDNMYEESMTAKVLSLSKQGFSSDEIAKKLNLGKGEVDLMIKFYQ